MSLRAFRALSPEGLARVLQFIRAHSSAKERTRDKTLLSFLYHCRLSIPALCSLTTSGIVLKDGLPHIISVSQGGRMTTMTLSGEARHALHHWLKKRKMLALTFPPKADPEAVWVNSEGRPLRASDVRALVRRYLKLAVVADGA